MQILSGLSPLQLGHTNIATAVRSHVLIIQTVTYKSSTSDKFTDYGTADYRLRTAVAVTYTSSTTLKPQIFSGLCL